MRSRGSRSAGRLFVEQVYDHQGNVGQGGPPLLVIDTWEHAYYLQYKNVKTDWVDGGLEHRQLARRRERFDRVRCSTWSERLDPRANRHPAPLRIACANNACRVDVEHEEREWPGVRVYLPILCMIVLVVLFASVSFVASKLLGPKRPTSAKQAPYECGIVPEYEPAERFPVKFYLVAMAFIVLDVEIVFLYPFTTVFRALGRLRAHHHGRVPAGAPRAVRLPPVHRRARVGPRGQATARVGARSRARSAPPGRDGLDPAAARPPDQPEKAA